MEEQALYFEKLHYLRRNPKGFKEGEKYPVILFLHGAGTRGSDIEILSKNTFFRVIRTYEDFPFVVVAPHCPNDETWFENMETLQRFVKSVAESDFADPSRIYLTGNSMGGYGSWELAMAMPEYFAAVVPICGGGMYWNAARLKNVPVWAFHGDADPTVFYEESKKMVEAVNKRGGNAKLTTYPGVKHDCWTQTYQNPETFAWLLAHENENLHVLEDEYADSKKFG